MLYRLVLRSGIAAISTCLVMVAVHEVSLRLPLDTTERYLMIFHINAIAIAVAFLWSLTASRFILVDGSLFVIVAMLPTLLMVMGH